MSVAGGHRQGGRCHSRAVASLGEGSALAAPGAPAGVAVGDACSGTSPLRGQTATYARTAADRRCPGPAAPSAPRARDERGLDRAPPAGTSAQRRRRPARRPRDGRRRARPPSPPPSPSRAPSRAAVPGGRGRRRGGDAAPAGVPAWPRPGPSRSPRPRRPRRQGRPAPARGLNVSSLPRETVAARAAMPLRTPTAMATESCVGSVPVAAGAVKVVHTTRWRRSGWTHEQEGLAPAVGADGGAGDGAHVPILDAGVGRPDEVDASVFVGRDRAGPDGVAAQAGRRPAGPGRTAPSPASRPPGCSDRTR